MEVVKSLQIGYCLGVEKTVFNARQMLQEAKRRNLPAYSIGSLIHNPDVIRKFEEEGLKVIHDPDVEPGLALVRAHGISKALENSFVEKGFEILDSTCPKIVAAKKAVLKAEKEGRRIIVVGIKNHAESICLLGVDENEKKFISCIDELPVVLGSISADEKVAVAVQSTFPEEEFEIISKELEAYFGNNVVFLNRLCVVCALRRKTALALTKKCDVVVVVGGKKSANTADLARYVSTGGKPVLTVENASSFTKELDRELSQYKTVGVTSGTSTPIPEIDWVCEHLESL